MDGTEPRRRTAGLAVASLVLGVLSIVCLGPLTGVPAIVLGHVARGHIRRQAGAVQGAELALAGLTLGYLSLLFFFALAGVLGAWALAQLRPTPAPPPTPVVQSCAANLKQISLALRMYSADSNDAFPPDFDTLVKANYLGARSMYRCPQRPGPAAPVDDAQPVDTFTDYLYFGRGQTGATVGATTVLACDKPGNHPGALNVCFGDGHVSSAPANDLDEALRQNGWTLPPPPPAAAVER